MLLYCVKTGRYLVKKINLEKTQRARLCSLSITEGAAIELIYKNSFGVVVLADGGQVALSKKIALGVEV